MYLQLIAEETDNQSDFSQEDHIDYSDLESRGQMRLPFDQDAELSN